ncbi:hypothetical protein TL16_g10243 [Triparma laevis f. inornata]|uniref:Uncharacterized protein n=2 Tax=Triparma laevis TaxID=1534972 RepID=A0A9W6ZSD0_9STRA|nr:hypothetical protein TrLO_g5441 [Triparma laevis f. longispina]GMH85478.1 hypothetical protein TL16_g10243 [Triparma laevis f. inornata]
MQIQTDETSDDTIEMTFMGPTVKELYDHVVLLSDATPEEGNSIEGIGGGGDAAFMNFCKAVEGGETGFIGGEDGQFDD